jgi:hypothetical protein
MPAILTVKDDVLFFSRRAATLHHHANVSGGRCGEWGTFGGIKNVSPSRTM